MRVVVASFPLSACAAAPVSPGAGVETAFAKAKTSPPLLRAFLQAMPKGGDLHSHLSGAVYAESYLKWGIEDGLCVDVRELVLTACGAGCGAETCGDVRDLATAVADRTFRGRLIDALSTRNYGVYQRSGHDQFFATFAAFGVARSRPAAMLAEVMARAGAQNVLYLELMVSPGMAAAAAMLAAQSLGRRSGCAAFPSR